MLKKCCRRLIERLKSYDLLDWGMFTLTFTLVLTVSVLVVTAVTPENKPWNAISYVLPAQVITADNYIPESFTRGDEVPVRITRVIDCINFTCPQEGLPTEVTVRWQLLNTEGGATTTLVTVLDAFPTTLVEGQEYRIGENSITTSQLAPIPVPAEAMGKTITEGGSALWRITGEVQPLVENAAPVPWQTQDFLVVAE